MPNVIRDTKAMLAGMTPVLSSEEFVFCTSRDAELTASIGASALGWFREDEGTTLILSHADAMSFGFADALPMRRIVLEVFSALDGVGLTAAVATALSDAGIACNMIAAYHHDHVFVPAAQADRALAVLQDLQTSARR